MRILGIDFETTGLLEDPEARVIEIGAVLWEVGRGPLEIMSQLTDPDADCFEVPTLITELTGITIEDISEFGIHINEGMDKLHTLMRKADYCMAHNAAFDKGMYDREISFWGADPVEKVWIDTMVDIEYPPHCQAMKLKYLAADHGIRLDEKLLHRALFDVSMMLSIADNYKLEDMVESAKSPTLEVRAMVTFDNKDLAKQMKFRWDAERKYWVKPVKELRIKEFKESCAAIGFEAKVLGAL